jgi:phospholipid-binding lipoprotein MlaA
MIGASLNKISTEERAFGAVRRTSLASAALSLVLAGGLMAAATSAFAQVAADPAAPPVVAAPPASAAADAAQSAYDPLEGFNRGTFRFSMGLDHAVLRPIAHGYMAVTPRTIQNRVSAVVYNLGEPSTTLNDILQGHPKRAGRSSARFLINSTVGVLGLWDVATKMKIPAHDADFGQTFGYYGVKPGPYLYVPVIGPSSFREGVGRVLDFFTDPVGIVGGGYTTTFGATRMAVQTVDIRARADTAFRALEDSTDPYATTRSAFGQYRAAFLREATGETQTLPDFDDDGLGDPPAAASDATPSDAVQPATPPQDTPVTTPEPPKAQ